MNETNGTVSDFILRPLVVEDLPRWLKLVQAAEIDQIGEARATEATLRGWLAWPRTRFWAAEAPGDPETLAGYAVLFAQIKERSALDLVVHPAYRRRRLGTLLLNHLLAEARSTGADYANFEVTDTYTGGIAFLEKAGFERFSDAWVLRAPPELDAVPPTWPEGYSASSMAKINDPRVLTEAMNRGYGDLWGHHENTAGGVKVEDAERALEYFGPEGVLVVLAPDGSPAGITRIASASKSGAEEDILDGPGIAPEHRSLNLHALLVRHALGRLRAMGRRPVRLESWGDAPETIATYEELGFRVVEHAVALRKRLG